MDIWVISSLGLEKVNKAAINIYVLVYVWTYIFISVVKIPRSRMAEL